MSMLTRAGGALVLLHARRLEPAFITPDTPFIHLIHQFNHHHSASSSSPPKNAHTQAGRLSENFTSFHSVSLGHVPHPATIAATHSNARRVLFSTCLQDSNNRMMAGSNGICLGAYAILVSPSHFPPFVRQGHKLYCRVCITLVQGVLTIYPLLPIFPYYELHLERVM